MTMQEYKRVQCPAILEPFWIGQGYGYKNMSPLLRTESWSGVPDDEIIYIPESAYDNGFLDPLGVYTKRDFIELAGNRAVSCLIIAIGSHRKPHGMKLRVKDRGIVKIENIVDDWRSKT